MSDSDDRQAGLSIVGETQTTKSLEGFAPGSFGCHEALHMASVLAEMVDERLCQHPAIAARKEWVAKANLARSTLHELYQTIGQEHA